MMLAPTSRTSSGWSALTVALVPTGMNCGVSTTPCGSVSRPRRARVDPSDGGGARTSNVAAPVTSAGHDVVPERGHVRLRAAGRRDLEPERRQVRTRGLGRDSALRRPVEETEAQEEGLVHV